MSIQNIIKESRKIAEESRAPKINQHDLGEIVWNLRGTNWDFEEIHHWLAEKGYNYSINELQYAYKSYSNFKARD